MEHGGHRARPTESCVGDTAAVGPAFVKGSVGGRLLGGSLAGAIGFGMAVLQAVLQVPLLLQVWPADVFAVWLGVLGLFGLITSVDVGFHAFVGAEINMLGGTKQEVVRRLLSSAMRMTTFSAVLQVTAGAIAVMIGRTCVGLGPVSRYLDEIGPPLLALSLSWLVAGTHSGLLCRLYLACGETVRYQLFGVAQKACTFLAVVATAWLGGGVLAVATSFAIASGLMSAAVTRDLKRRHAGMMPRWTLGDWRHGVSDLKRSLGISIAMFFDQIANGGLAAFVSAALPATKAAQFATVRSLTNAVSHASGVVMFPAVPELGRDATAARIGRAALLMDAMMVACVTPLAIVSSIAAAWIPDLYHLWTRGALPFDPQVFTALAAAVLIRQVGMPFQLFLIATNRVRSQFIATSLRAGVLAAGIAAQMATGTGVGIAVALALAEVAVLVYARAATALAFRGYGGSLSSFHTRLVMLHTVLTVVVMFVTFRDSQSTAMPSIVGCLVHLGIVAAQATRVPAAIRDRLSSWWQTRAVTCLPESRRGAAPRPQGPA